MKFKKSLKRISQIESRQKRADQQGQAVVEYALLVAIAILAFLAVDFIIAARNNAFNNHFKTVATYITNQAFK